MLPLIGMAKRRLLRVALDRMAEEPVVLLQGPRTVGKSRLLGELANASGGEVVDLDDPAVREAVAADPSLFTRRSGPVLVDEYQHVPEVLDAIKAELNRDLRPGRFVLAGSTRYDALPAASQSLTGRLHRLDVEPLSVGEVIGVGEHLLADLFEPFDPTTPRRSSSTTRDAYLDVIAVGGLPLALARRTPSSRNRWFDDYIRLTIERDVSQVATLRRGALMPRFLERLAAQTGQVLNLTAASAAAGFDRTTGETHLRLLEAVFLIRRLPAWGPTLRARATSSPKIHVVDTGVAARLLRVTPDRLRGRDPAALTELGHLLETFVVGEMRKQASWMEGIAGLGHWRTSDGVEVDLVVERDDGAIVAFEVKAASRVREQDLRGLARLRDAVGPRFVRGVAFYLGEHSYRAGERLDVLPLDRIWTP